MVKKILIIVLCVGLFSCQDTKTKKSKPQKVIKKEKGGGTMDQELREQILSSSSRNKRSDFVYDTITTVDQIHLKPFLEEYGKKNPESHAVIKTEFGDIEIELFKDTPWHRANFIRLAKLDYFNTTYFYRVTKDFVIQAGNSDNSITGEMRSAIGDYLIPKEFSKKHLNDYGAVGAAKFSKQNVSKASSPFEFYIVMDKEGAHHLDFEHTVFGRVIKGMDVAQKINQVKTDQDSDWPVDNIEVGVEVQQ